MNGETSERAAKRVKVEDESSTALNGSSSKAAKLEGADEDEVKQVLKQEQQAEEADEIDDNYGIYEHFAQDAAAEAAPAGDLYLDTVSAALSPSGSTRSIDSFKPCRSTAVSWTSISNAYAPSACPISTSTRASYADATSKDEARVRMRTHIQYTTITTYTSTFRL